MTPNARILADAIKTIKKDNYAEHVNITERVKELTASNPDVMQLLARKTNQWAVNNPNITMAGHRLQKRHLKLLDWLIFELAIKPEALVLDALYDVDPFGKEDGVTSSKKRPFAICTQVHALLDSMPQRKKWYACEELVQHQYACGMAQYLLESAINNWPKLNGHPTRFPVEGNETEFFNAFDRGELWKNPHRHELWHHMIARMEEVI